MQKFTIVFKSGAMVDFTADEMTVTYNTITGQLTSYKYTKAPANKPLYLNMAEVAGIFQNPIHEEEEKDHENV